MSRCDICGGLTRCPEPVAGRALRQDEVLYLPATGPVPEGWQVTHWRKRQRLAIPERAIVVGSRQRARVEAHAGPICTWVGWCKYAYMPVGGSNGV